MAIESIPWIWALVDLATAGSARRIGWKAANFSRYYNLMASKFSHKGRWERGFAALSKFRKRNGHCCAPIDHVEGKIKLGRWVITQRYLKDELTVERKQRLDRIKFVWNLPEHRWENGFKSLLKFRKREGHCRVPIFHNEGRFRLGWWVSTQRVRKEKLSGERKARLNKIGFVWKADRGSGLIGAKGIKQKNSGGKRRGVKS